MNPCPLNSRGRARPRSAGVPDVPWEPVVIWGQTSHGEVGTGDLGPCGEAEARRWGRAASQAVVDARSRPSGGQRPALSCQTAGHPGRAPPQRVPVRSRRGLKLGLAVPAGGQAAPQRSSFCWAAREAPGFYFQMCFGPELVGPVRVS